MRLLSKSIRKSLCGLLSAAMILTSVSIPSVAVFAEEADAEEITVEAMEEAVVETAQDDVEKVETEEAEEEIVLAAAEEVTFYYYTEEECASVDLVFWGDCAHFSSTAVTREVTGSWTATGYDFSKVTDKTGWYQISLSIDSAAAVDSPTGGFELWTVDGDGKKTSGYELSEWNNTALYKALCNATTSIAIKDGKAYESIEAADEVVIEYPITITLNYYAEEIDNLDFVWWGSDFSTSDSATSETLEGSWSATGYRLNKVDGNDGWYTAEFKTNSAGGTGFELWSVKDGAVTAETKISEWDNSDIFAAVLALENGESIAIRGGKAYATIEEADKGYYTTALNNQITIADRLIENEDLYTAESFAAMQEKLTAAKAVVTKGEEATLTEIKTAYEELKAAIEGLETKSKVKTTINVTPVALSSSFITGADLSSYLAIRESGVVFKDEDGNPLSDQEFFDYLAAGGTNWVRIRVWNNPYDGGGNGYGGGNSDLDKAVIIGQLASRAGMKVLIDFHYSDFWADPAKYTEPKAYSGLNADEKADEVYTFTFNALNRLINSSVDVGMVQVGNETNSGICGETSWENMAKIFNAGAGAVRDVADNQSREIMVAVHYTDPQNGFDKYASKLKEHNVDYDVFAASFYPYWHGTTAQLTESLSQVASTYNKKVMVAETSWATTWEDGDGHENTAPKTSGQSLAYDISVQGQADEMRDVVNAVNNATNGIGVFYWEPAWLSANYVYNADGSIDQKLLNANKTGWEKYGAGWASSYSAEYDPSDAGLWYGGSAIDNQAWFGFDGTALATAKAYSLIRTGAEADKAISQFTNPDDINVAIGGTVEYPTTVSVKFNDGTTEDVAVTWNEKEMALVSTDKLGSFKVTGEAVCEYETDGKNVVEKKTVTITINVIAKANLLTNPGFENGTTGWAFGGTTPGAASVKAEANNVRNGSKALNFYFGTASDFTVSQTVKNITPGIYTFGAFIQGGSAGGSDKQIGFAEVYNSNDELKVKYTGKTSLSGWLNWNDPKVTGIKVEEGDYLVVGMDVMSSEDGAWGWIDDAYLYGSHSVNVSEDIKNGTVTLSNHEATAAEVITVTVKPATAYKIKNITFAGVDDTFVPSVAGTYDSEAGIYTVDLEAQNITDVKDITFAMPDAEVTVSAEFVSVFGTDKIDITDNEDVIVSIDEQYATGKLITPTVKVSYKGYVLTTADYSVTFKNNKDVYTYVSTDAEFDVAKAPTAVIKAKGTKFTGTKSANFVINEDTRIDLANKNVVKVEISSAYDNEKKSSFYFTGDEIKPNVHITYKKDDVVSDVDSDEYKVVYSTNIKPGKATITVVPANDSTKLKNSAQINFVIEKRPVDTLTISRPASGAYTGKAITPIVRVTYENKVLKNGTDYTVKYYNNVKVSEGAAYLTVIGKGNYAGTSAKKYFNIVRRQLKTNTVKIDAATLSATSREQSPKITITDIYLGKKLTTADYEIADIKKRNDETGEFDLITGLKVKEAGLYQVRLVGKNNYTGSALTEFRVIDAAHNITNFKIKTTPKTYTGNAVRLAIDELVVTYGTGKNQVTLHEGSEFTATYTNSQSVGTATVTIVGMGGYYGSKSATFKINPAKITSAYAKGTEIPDGATGYIEWKLAEKEGKAPNTAYTGYAITPDLEVTYGIVDVMTKNVMVKDRDYTVTFANNVKAGSEATITIKGKGNYTGAVVIRKDTFTITDKKLSDYIVSIAPVEYTGKAIKPVITFTDKATGENVDLKAGVAYTATYKNNTNVAGKNSSKAPTVTIKETGLNKDATRTEKAGASYTFTITTATIKSNCVADIAIQKYANKPVTPAVNVKVNGRALKLNKDYVVSYTNNGRPGTATAVIKGIGNYSGTVSKTFVIK